MKSIIYGFLSIIFSVGTVFSAIMFGISFISDNVKSLDGLVCGIICFLLTLLFNYLSDKNDI